MSNGIKLNYCGFKKGKVTRDSLIWGLTGADDLKDNVELLGVLLHNGLACSVKDGIITAHIGFACGNLLQAAESGKIASNWLKVEMKGALEKIWKDNRFLEIHKELQERRQLLNERQARVSTLKKSMAWYGPVKNWPEADVKELVSRELERDSARAQVTATTKSIIKHLHSLMKDVEDKILNV